MSGANQLYHLPPADFEVFRYFGVREQIVEPESYHPQPSPLLVEAFLSLFAITLQQPLASHAELRHGFEVS